MFNDEYKPPLWKQWYSFGLMCLGFGVGRYYQDAPTYDVKIVVGVIEFFAASQWWMWTVDFLEWRRDYRRMVWSGDEPKKGEAEAKPRKLIDLSYKDNKWQGVAVNVKQRDARWQLFAEAIINGQPMTQSKWTGKGRPFSKPEFVKQINKWVADLIIVHKKIKGSASSYRPNGADGWAYFKALADGRAWLPLPSKDLE